jgi:hypothetical protein
VYGWASPDFDIAAQWEAGLMNFWWATQTTNYPEAIANGTLWTCPRAYGQPLKESRRLIKDLRVGDVVFHYQDRFLRAVSTVTEEWCDFTRPAEYPRRDGEGDDGWLVSVDLDLGFRSVGELINKGNSGPLGSNGIPAQKYLSRLSEEEGIALLNELKVTIPLSEDVLLGRPLGFWDGAETDSGALGKIRKEQGDLRRNLLRGRTSADCSICGALLPSRLLIAGHIKPRSKCSDEERRDYGSAMLVCSLGCDALFEWGYVIVDATGTVRPGRTPETASVQAAVSVLSGRACSAFNPHTAARFEAHATTSGGLAANWVSELAWTAGSS